METGWQAVGWVSFGRVHLLISKVCTATLRTGDSRFGRRGNFCAALDPVDALDVSALAGAIPVIIYRSSVQYITHLTLLEISLIYNRYLCNEYWINMQH